MSNSIEIYPSIFQFNNFMDSSDLEIVMNYLDNTNDDDWSKINDDNVNFINKRMKISSSPIKLYLEKYNEKAKNICNKTLNSTFEYTGGLNIIRTYNFGMNTHHDSGGKLSIKYGLVYYLNDNYIGGEIVYPKLNISIKPKANSLLIHPGSIEYSHKVNNVLNGTRYCVTLFATKK